MEQLIEGCYSHSVLVNRAMSQFQQSFQVCYSRLVSKWTAGRGAVIDWTLQDVMTTYLKDWGAGVIPTTSTRNEEQSDIRQAATQLHNAIEKLEIALSVTASIFDKFGDDVCRTGAATFK